MLHEIDQLWIYIIVGVKITRCGFVWQVLTYAQQSRERSNYEQAALSERMQEYKRQVDRESRWSSNGSNGSPNGGDGIQAIGRSSHKMIEEVMQSAAKGKVRRKYCIFVCPFALYHCSPKVH